MFDSVACKISTLQRTGVLPLHMTQPALMWPDALAAEVASPEARVLQLAKMLHGVDSYLLVHGFFSHRSCKCLKEQLRLSTARIDMNQDLIVATKTINVCSSFAKAQFNCLFCMMPCKM